jgi:hypothetical protein
MAIRRVWFRALLVLRPASRAGGKVWRRCFIVLDYKEKSALPHLCKGMVNMGRNFSLRGLSKLFLAKTIGDEGSLDYDRLRVYDFMMGKESSI